MDETSPVISEEARQNRSRIYELVPQMRVYHRLLHGQIWLPFVMRAVLPNIRQDVVNTDQWGLRHTIGREGRVLTVDSVAADEPVDIVTGSSFAFGVGASTDASTLGSNLAQMTGRATVLLSGHQYALTQSFVQFMLFSSRFRAIRNIVVAGFGELFYFHTCSSLHRRFGLFPNNEKFMSELNPGVPGRLGTMLYGGQRKPFMPLSHTADQAETEREALRSCIRDVLTSWSRYAGALGARLTVVVQPTPNLQPRRLAAEEMELLQNYERVSGLREAIEACRRDYDAWHAADMAALAVELGFTYVDINTRLDQRFDGEWLHIDPMHMADLGYRRAAEEIVPELA